MPVVNRAIHRLIRPIVAVLLILLLAPRAVCAQNATFYVRVSGSDSNDGLSAGAAFRTIQKAVRSCTASGGGYTIRVGPGTYHEMVAITAAAGAASGTLAHPNCIAGDPTGANTGDTGGPVIIHGGAVRTCGIQVDDRDHWSFSNLTIREQTGYGLLIRSGRGFSIADCSIRPTGLFGVYAHASDITIDRNTFIRDAMTRSCVSVVADGSGYITARRNRYSLIGADYLSRGFAHGINFGSLFDRSGFIQNVTQTFLYGICVYGEWGRANVVTIENNVGSDCFLGVYASVFAHPGSRIEISSNTVTGCCYPIYLASLFTGPTIARNNIVADCYYPVAGLAPAGRVEGLLSHRITTGSFLSSGIGNVTGSIAGDPRFRAPASGDFSLMADSPALDAGVADTSVGEDILGNPRPTDGNADGVIATDLGAYESNPRRRWRLTRAQEARPPLATLRIGAARTLQPAGASGAVTTVGGSPISSLLRQLFPGD